MLLAHSSNLTPWISLAFIGLMAILPFLQPYHTHPITTFYSEWVALTLGLASSIILLQKGFWTTAVIARVAIYWLGLLVVILTQFFFIHHAYITQSLIPALYIAWAILLILVSSWLRQYFSLDKVVYLLAWAILMGGVLQMLLALSQYTGFYGNLEHFVILKNGATIYGNLAQQNHFSSQIMLASIGLIYLFALRKISWIFTLLLTSLFVLVMALSSSRAVLLYSIGLFLISLLSYRKTPDDIHARFAVMSIILLIMFLLSQYFLPTIITWMKIALSTIGLDTSHLTLLTALDKLRDGSSGIELRLSEWHKAWLMFLESPLLGVGTGHYAWYSYLYQMQPEFSGIPKPDLFRHSHNIFMQTLAETGALGILLLAAMLWGWLKQFRNHWTSPTSWLIAGCLMVILIHSNVEYPLWYSYFLGITAVLITLGDERIVTITFSPRLGQLGTSLALLLMGSILLKTLTDYHGLDGLTWKEYKDSPSQVASKLIKISANPILTPYTELLMAKLISEDKDSIEPKLAIMRRLTAWNPTPIHLYKMTLLLALNNQSETARKLLYQATMVYPDQLSSVILMLRAMPEKEIQPLLAEAEKIARERNIPLTPSPAPLAGAP